MNVTLKDIDERLQQSPPDKLGVVYDFVSYLLERSDGQEVSALQTMLASESVLKRDWERPEEDEAWAHL
jgi:TorA maturation chaperone TorD